MNETTGKNDRNSHAVDAVMNSTRFGYPLLANVATPAEGYSNEFGTMDVVRRGDTNYGMPVSANIPIDPYWNESPDLTDIETRFSLSLRENHLNPGEQYKGTMNATIKEKILDTRYQDGGALLETMPSDSSVNIYQFVYVPETLDTYSKGPDLS